LKTISEIRVIDRPLSSPASSFKRVVVDRAKIIELVWKYR